MHYWPVWPNCCGKAYAIEEGSGHVFSGGRPYRVCGRSRSSGEITKQREDSKPSDMLRQVIGESLIGFVCYQQELRKAALRMGDYAVKYQRSPYLLVRCNISISRNFLSVYRDFSLLVGIYVNI